MQAMQQENSSGLLDKEAGWGPSQRGQRTATETVFQCVLRPTFYLHTTFLGMTWLCETTGEKVKIYGTTVEHATARDVLPLAHILLIHAADVANDLYKLGQNERIKKIASDWKALWDLVPASPIEDADLPTAPPQS